MHVMLRDLIHLYRTERAKSYMQRNSCNVYAFSLNLFEQFRRKMQAGRRRGRGAGVGRIDRLIAVLISRPDG